MKEILQTIIEPLVSKPEQIVINEKETERGILLEVSVNESDMGRVIGKQGIIAKAIRTIMKSIASKENKRVTIEFIDK